MDRYMEMEAALAPLWRIPSPQPDGIFQHPSFRALETHCRSQYPSANRGLFTSFAIWQGLCLLGVPCAQPPGLLNVELADAAKGLVDALETQKVTRRYIVPLNLGGDIPHLQFGNAEVNRFPLADLRILFEESTIRRLHTGPSGMERLSEFYWLVVEDTVEVAGHISARLAAFDFRRDMGAINPHEGRFPEQVTQALFALLLQPWEDWHSYREIDWRPFTVPWVHVVTGDIFERANPIPSPDSLTWEPAFDPDGNEYERPGAYHFCGNTHAGLAHVDEAYWAKLQAARVGPLFETPIEHFMLRAFFSDGMDEIIAHITAIEAALGLQSDFTKAGRNRHPKMPPTHRVTRRVQILLGDDAAGDAYTRLFNIRSEFVHGRQIGVLLSSETRNLARSLARRVTAALLDRTPDLPPRTTREAFLASLC